MNITMLFPHRRGDPVVNPFVTGFAMLFPHRRGDPKSLDEIKAYYLLFHTGRVIPDKPLKIARLVCCSRTGGGDPTVFGVNCNSFVLFPHRRG